MDKTTKTILGILVFVLAFAAVYYGVKKSQTASLISEIKKPIKIGAILPLTGNAAQYGQESKEGIDLAVEEINREGGVNQRLIEIVYEDSLGDSAMGVEVYQKLSNIDKIKVYLATLSNVSLSVGPLAQKNKDILFVVGSASPSIAKTGDFVFKNNIDTGGEATEMAKFAHNILSYRKIAILMVNSDAGQTYAQHFRSVFESLGGEIVFSELYGEEDSDHRTSLSKIKSLQPEAIYIMDRTKGLADVLIEAEEWDLGIPFLGIYGTESSKLLELVGKEILEGIIYTTSIYDPDGPDPLMKEFNRKFEEKYGYKAEYFAALGYDNMRMLAEVMKRCDDPENTICIKDKLFNLYYKGVTGETSFNEVGNARKPVIFKSVRNGKFLPYEEK